MYIVQMYLSHPGVDEYFGSIVGGNTASELESGRKQIRVDSGSESQSERGHLRRDQEDCSW